MGFSILEHLVFGSSQEELYATKGMAYILNNSRKASCALIFELNRKLNITLDPNIIFYPEESSDGGRPDIIGRCGPNNALILEGKFWASLTSNQPDGYLNMLKDSGGQICLFIAPESRIATLWPELIRRTKNAGLTTKEEHWNVGGISFCTFNEHSVALGLTSWGQIINILLTEAEKCGDRELLADVYQLKGLCDRMGESGFVPLQASDLESVKGKIYGQLQALCKKLRDLLVLKNEFTYCSGCRDSTDSSASYFPINIKGYNAYLQFHVALWSKYCGTPLWLRIYAKEDGLGWKMDPEMRKKLHKFELTSPPELIEHDNIIYIPLFPRTGVEEQAVLDDLVEQVMKIAHELS